MSRSNTVDMMGQASEVRVTGEPRDTETVRRGSERGRWKSTHQGNSLASYSTYMHGSEAKAAGVTPLP
jgi:hypothetical protein